MLKRIVITSLSLFTATAFADIPDYYTGLQLGYGNTPKSNANLTLNSQAVVLTQHKNSGVTGRLFVGYAVTPFYAMELSLSQYNTISWRTSINGQAVKDTTVALSGADVAMRFSWIKKYAFSLYNRLGLSYIRAHYGSYNDAFQLNKVCYFLRPEIGVGGNYDVSSSTQLNVSYNHIFGRGHLSSAVNANHSSDYLPTIGITSVGVIYNF